MENFVQAISVANSYFALADGLADGIHNYLSEDVILDWFGWIVEGRKNVSAFMESHDSRHIYSYIVPTTNISYKKKKLKRLFKFRSYCRQNQEFVKKDFVDNNKDESSHREMETSSNCDVETNVNQNEIDAKEISAMNDSSYDLSEGDLFNLFKLEISTSSTEEIEESINRIKLEEEMAPTIKAIKRENDPGDENVIVGLSTPKYIEAYGEMEFSRRYWKRDICNAYSVPMSNVHTWKRPCKLQIAYSTEHPTLKLSSNKKNTEKDRVRFGHSTIRLPTLEEINQISDRLVPNKNNFGGFLKNTDFFEDLKDFIKNLEKEPCKLFNPYYVEKKLVFDKPGVNANDSNDSNDSNDKKKKMFLYNYQIHLIIYEDSENELCKNLKK
ncbi:uncharacterized protein LOC122720121 isoform X1 [Apis laboriosa]|uniref:uncharacterized protein LOC122720121 isoform X1 n=1 Tax=Apis laboriosa TaxID=183418 RepID=UPI001CC3787B|nr:uncharacterized protein LOC122720121 isoform X1 [Apis laboriosa]XP_043802545.1 uncharacterized protein LOC122720121 isoform X1 [Apis laboriosa]XP_043802546.1 uncharacterized protein LOC122720121 isoform X1 [Apis laboriosa]